MLAVAEQTEGRMRPDDALLVEKRELARLLEHALDHEHHVGPARIVFVEDQRDVVLQRPGQDAVLEGGDLLAVLQHDGVLADEIDAATRGCRG